MMMNFDVSWPRIMNFALAAMLVATANLDGAQAAKGDPLPSSFVPGADNGVAPSRPNVMGTTTDMHCSHCDMCHGLDDSGETSCTSGPVIDDPTSCDVGLGVGAITTGMTNVEGRTYFRCDCIPFLVTTTYFGKGGCSSDDYDMCPCECQDTDRCVNGVIVGDVTDGNQDCANQDCVNQDGTPFSDDIFVHARRNDPCANLQKKSCLAEVDACVWTDTTGKHSSANDHGHHHERGCHLIDVIDRDVFQGHSRRHGTVTSGEAAFLHAHNLHTDRKEMACTEAITRRDCKILNNFGYKNCDWACPQEYVGEKGSSERGSWGGSCEANLDGAPKEVLRKCDYTSGLL